MNYPVWDDKIIIANEYGGMNGKKKTALDNNTYYMLKEQTRVKEHKRNAIAFNRRQEISYNNSVYSEYVGSKLINFWGFDDTYAQDTKLVYLNGKLNVACKELCLNRKGVVRIISLKDIVKASSDDDEIITDLNEILTLIENQQYVDPNELKTFFWNQFVLDAMINNYDRHIGNWGFLYNHDKNEYSICPIYDNGSSLQSKIDLNVLNDIVEQYPNGYFKDRAWMAKSAITLNGKRFKYRDFLATTDNIDCLQSLKHFTETFDLAQTKAFINELELTENQKKFYQYLITNSYQHIIENALENNPHLKKLNHKQKSKLRK